MALAVEEAIEKYTVTREKRAASFNMPESHYHDHYEIYFLTRGSVRYFIGDKVYDLLEGDMALIPPHVIHKTATLEERGSERMLIAFTPEFILRRPDDRILECFRLGCFKKPPVSNIIYSAEKEAQLADEYSEELISGYIREILIALTRLYEKDYKPGRRNVNPTVESAVHYIADNYGADISLSSVARHFAVSESHFSRQFKLYTGFGLNEYITLVRVKNAERLLLTSHISVTEAAARCGFNSSSYFTAVFHKIRGVTPKSLQTKSRRIENI